MIFNVNFVLWNSQRSSEIFFMKVRCWFITFLVNAFGKVPNCGASVGRSTGLLMSDGTDSVLRILVTKTKQEDYKRSLDSLSEALGLGSDSRTHLGGTRSDRTELLSYIYCDILTCSNENGSQNRK